MSAAPTVASLKAADIYIIADPDDEKETPKPNFIEAGHIAAIKDWVKRGSAPVLMGNDFGNCEFDHFNNPAKEFGIVFNYYDQKSRRACKIRHDARRRRH